jgi:hypothetical protein
MRPGRTISTGMRSSNVDDRWAGSGLSGAGPDLLVDAPELRVHVSCFEYNSLQFVAKKFSYLSCIRLLVHLSTPSFASAMGSGSLRSRLVRAGLRYRIPLMRGT